MLLASTYFFYMITPRLRLANANLRPGSSIPLGLTLYYHLKYTLNVTTKCPLQGTYPQELPRVPSFFTTQCTLSGTTHTVRPYMYPQVVHSLERTPFRSCTTYTDTSCLTLLMVSSGNTCWDIIPTLSPPMCHTHRFHYRSKM